MMQEKLKVGAAQIAPRFLDKAGTIKRIGQTLEEAGRLGLDLLVFPETFLSAYPYWRGAVSVRRETELTAATPETRLLQSLATSPLPTGPTWITLAPMA